MVINAINAVGTSTSSKAKAECFANLSDEEVLYLAHDQALSDKKTGKQQKMTRSLIKTVPIVDSMIAASYKAKAPGLVGFGTLSTSLKAFAGRLTSWAMFFVGFDVLDKLFDKAAKKSETISNIEENHPMARPLSELAIVLAAYYGGKKHKNKLNNLKNSIIDSLENSKYKKISNLTASLKKNGLEKLSQLKKVIDSSIISRKIYEPVLKRFTKGAEKYPKLAASAKALKPLVVPMMIVASLVKTSIIDPLAYSKKVANNYVSLKEQQEELKTALDVIKMQEEKTKTVMNISNQKLGGY